MNTKIETLAPMEIEKRSFEIITAELKGRKLNPEHELIIKRAIHTSADFDYVDNLCFSDDVVGKIITALKNGACIVTDTNMAKAGISKATLEKFGGEVYCFISDEDVADEAKERGVTRATISMEKAARLDKPVIFAIGNAPTALIELHSMITAGKISPEAIIGVPVGFVNVVESKELIMTAPVPYIVARGRKGGSNIAAAIINAILYIASDRKI